MKTGLAVGLIVASVVVAGGGGFAINYALNKPIVETYEEQISALQASLDAIGEITTCYTVRANTPVGAEITFDMLEEQSIPSSFVGANVIHNADTIIGQYAKVAIAPGTTITADLLIDDDINNEKALWHTVRLYDVACNMWPIGLAIGDYVDLRMIMPYGEEYIVLSHMRVDGMSDSTVRFKLTEAQINLYQSALVDYYLNAEQGVRLYFTKYLEPGVQKPANITYKVSEEIMRAMQKNSNLYATAWASVYDATTRSDIETDLLPTESDLEQGDEDRSGIISGGRDDWISSVQGGESSYIDGDTPTDDEEEGEDFVW